MHNDRSKERKKESNLNNGRKKRTDKQLNSGRNKEKEKGNK